MEKENKKTHIRAIVDSGIKRRFDAAWGFKGIAYNDAIEKAMELFTKQNIMEPDLKKLREVL